MAFLSSRSDGRDYAKGALEPHVAGDQWSEKQNTGGGRVGGKGLAGLSWLKFGERKGEWGRGVWVGSGSGGGGWERDSSQRAHLSLLLWVPLKGAFALSEVLLLFFGQPSKRILGAACRG